MISVVVFEVWRLRFLMVGPGVFTCVILRRLVCTVEINLAVVAMHSGEPA